MQTPEKMNKMEELAKNILSLARNSLIVNLRFMDSALSRLTHVADEKETLSTDGENIYYNPMEVLKSFKTAKELPSRQYLHMIFHCIYRHMFVGSIADNRLWNLACDIAVENSINELNVPSANVGDESKQQAEIDSLKKNVKYITAEVLYRHFLDGNVSEEKLSNLEKLFCRDDHKVWYNPKNQGSGSGENNDENNAENVTAITVGITRTELQEMWKNISEQIQIALETLERKRGNLAGGLTQNLREVNREKYDYTSFLKKFAVMGEAMKINNDEFDNIFYTYGLQIYEKMPLIEPLEYKEIKRIREFVIAIDTSGSVSGELVQTFIQKTYNILMQTESYFSKVNIHIIQCDAAIQDDVKITSQQDFDEYIKKMKLHGFGGTDFRPVFRFVDNLIEQGEFTNLKGLIYFTDGFGVFPSHQPSYNTAFVYVNDGYANPEVPVWAIKLILQPEEI